MLHSNNTLKYGDVEMMSTYPVSRPTFLLPKNGGIERVEAFLVVYSRKFESYGEPIETYPIVERGFIKFEEPCRAGEAYCFHGPLSKKDPFYKEVLEHGLKWIEYENEEEFLKDCAEMGLEIID